MKTKGKVLLSSVASIALCSSIAVGGTYALFTSESKANIAVTSGKVEVIANITDLTTSTTIENSTAMVAASVVGNSVTLNNIVPGDCVTFNIAGENLSTITTQYRVKIACEEGLELMSGLVVTIGTNEYTSLYSYTSAWNSLAAKTDMTAIPVAITLPKNAGNEYQGLAADLVVTLEAIQGNATVTGEEEIICFDIWNGEADSEGLTENTDTENKTVSIESAEQLAAFSAKVNSGVTYKDYVVSLANDIYLNNMEWTPIGPNADAANKFQGIFDGQNYTIYDLSVAQTAGYHAAGLFGALNGTVQNLVIDGASVSNLSSGAATDNGTAVVAGSIYTKGTINNVTVKNATVTANRYVGGIAGYAYGNITNCTVENSTINAYMDALTGSLDNGDKVGGIVGYYSGEGSYKFDNNTVKGCALNAARDVAGLAGVISTVGSSFESNTVSDTKISYSLDRDYGAAAEIVTQRTTVVIPNSNTANNVTIEKVATSATVDSDEALDDAIQGGATKIVLGSGNYIIPYSAKGKTLTIIGNGDTVILPTKIGSGGENVDYGLDGSTVTFENITITTNSSTYMGYARLKATYNNCTINGTYTLYGDSTFNNCTFNVSGDVYNIWTWGAPNATFDGCTFNSDGKALLLYGTENTNLTVKNCVFNDNGGLTDLKAAIEIGDDYGKSYTLTVNNTVVNGYEINDKGINTNSTLWANKNSMGTDNLNVVVDGVDVY